MGQRRIAPAVPHRPSGAAGVPAFVQSAVPPRRAVPWNLAAVSPGTLDAQVDMARARQLDATLTGFWSAIRFSAGMLIVTGVFVLAHGLVFVYELAGTYASEPERP
jgi:hypothetical protein